MASIFSGVQHAERDIATPEEKRRRKELLAPLEGELARTNEQIARLRERAKPLLEPHRDAVLARFRPPVNPQSTEERFTPVRARFVRFDILATNSGVPPSLEELEVWNTSGVNTALAGNGARVTADSTRSAPEEGIYAPSALIDGKHDRRWLGGVRNSATITIELAGPAEIDRFVWCADYLGGLKTRIDATLPSDYRVEVSNDGKTWSQVASSRDRLPFPEKDREDFLLRSVLSADEQAQWRDLAATGAKLKQQIAEVPPLPAAYIGKFQQPKDPIYLLKGGSVANPGDPVAPASLSTLATVLPGFELALDAPEAQRRMALAHWIVDERNPLTPRVMANRIWHYHFGRGLVGTPSDFGFNGEQPSHPELLDYLARRLLELNWKMKPCIARSCFRPRTARPARPSRRFRRSMPTASICGASRRSDWRRRRFATPCWPYPARSIVKWAARVSVSIVTRWTTWRIMRRSMCIRRRVFVAASIMRIRARCGSRF